MQVRLQIPELELKYKSCYARILDAKRRFLEAATRYYDLSQTGDTNADAGIKVRHACLLQPPKNRYQFYSTTL